MRQFALILPAILALAACGGDGPGLFGGRPSAAPQSAPVTPGRVISSNPSTSAAAAAAAADAAGGRPF